MCKAPQESVATFQKQGNQNLLIFTMKWMSIAPQHTFLNLGKFEIPCKLLNANYLINWISINFMSLQLFIDLWSWFLVLNYIKGVSNGLCEHLRACKQCVYFCKHEWWLNLSWKKRALDKNQTNFPTAGNFFKRKRCFVPTKCGWHFQNKKIGTKLIRVQLIPATYNRLYLVWCCLIPNYSVCYISSHE